MVNRVYLCHTFYHAYVACVKELLRRRGEGSLFATGSVKAGAGSEEEDLSGGYADLILSTMSNDWGEFPERIRNKGLFRKVLFYHEQTGAEDAGLQALHRDRGNLLLNLIQRVRYTRRLGKLQEEHVPVDLGSYGRVEVFCDSDPIGYYLNYRRIPYHAVEDGLNSGKLDNQAMLSNRGAFRLKAFLAGLGLIFIECGYSRYCIDYEVNDLSANYRPPKNTVEVPRRALYDRLSAEDHALLAEVFLPDAAGLQAVMERCTKPAAMILTEPLCSLDVRERLFGDVIGRYYGDYDVIVKPHPRDQLDYTKCYRDRYPGIHILTGRFPMEALDDLASFRIRKLVSVITQVDDVRFAQEMEYLGSDFLDAYEDPAIHRKMELLKAEGNGAGPARDGTAGDRTVTGKAPGVRDGKGPRGTADRRLRAATPADRDWWLAVRNDAESRKQSFQEGEIDPETHAKWFAAKLASPTERLYVLEEEGKPVAQLRLTAASGETADTGRGQAESEEKTALRTIEISYAVAPGDRGRGIGRDLIRMAVETAPNAFWPDGDGAAAEGLLLRASVKEGNEASRRIFREAGFTEEPSGEAAGAVRYRKELSRQER